MDARTLSIFFLLLTPVVIEPLQFLDGSSNFEIRRHIHSKRHMLTRDAERHRRMTTQRPKGYRKKPTGHLRPLQEDDIENDEVVSVAIGPPAMRPKYDKIFKRPTKIVNQTTSNNIDGSIASNLIKDVLVQLGSEFLTRQVNEDFIFGQYVGNSMRNLTSDLRVKMQHEVLDLILKYQRTNREGVENLVQTTNSPENKKTIPLREIKQDKKKSNDTEEAWPDFTNLANIVG